MERIDRTKAIYPAGHRTRTAAPYERSAHSLGWLSLALGVVEVALPRTTADVTGSTLPNSLVRALGAREIANGVALLTQSRTSRWMWARVAGDGMDLALLAVSLANRRADRRRIAASMAAVAAIAAADVTLARRLERRESSEPGGVRRDGSIRVEQSVTINRPPEECYRVWRDFKELPRFMQHVQAVEPIDERRSHWIVKAPAGRRVEWDAEITRDEPNALISWRTLPHADVEHGGAVRFIPVRGSGTIVSVTMQYTPPLRTAGAWIAKLFGEEPEQQVREDLRRFKRILETGEIPTTQGQPAGRRSGLFRSLAKVNPA